MSDDLTEVGGGGGVDHSGGLHVHEGGWTMMNKSILRVRKSTQKTDQNNKHPTTPVPAAK